MIATAPIALFRSHSPGTFAPSLGGAPFERKKNALYGYAIRATILALASWPLAGVLDHDKVISQRQLAKICEDRPPALYVDMHRRMAAREAIPNALVR